VQKRAAATASRPKKSASKLRAGTDASESKEPAAGSNTATPVSSSSSSSSEAVDIRAVNRARAQAALADLLAFIESSVRGRDARLVPQALLSLSLLLCVLFSDGGQGRRVHTDALRFAVDLQDLAEHPQLNCREYRMGTREFLTWAEARSFRCGRHDPAALASYPFHVADVGHSALGEERNTEWKDKVATLRAVCR
jgi:hypothetical protein